MRLFCIRVLLLLLAAAATLCAQDEIPAGGRGGRGGRGGTREFLGLGAAPDTAAAARGEKVYAPNCAFCHGEKARGAEGPNLVRSALVLHDEKGELIGALIAKGVPDKGMPAFPNFSLNELSDLAQFLHLQVELVANRGLYRRLNVVTGDPSAGEKFFSGAGGCGSCHSPTGDLAHVAARYPQADQLQNRWIWPAGGRGAARAQEVTVTPASGTPVSGTLKQLDDVNVSLVDPAGFYRSFARENVKVDVEDRLAAHRRLLEVYTDSIMHDVTAYLVTLK